ncbi:MAG TPA: hypothetical protein VFS40_08630 [Gemmatimonadales bacterium]|nr:hypothetical protein [Gemmatimonadales bacterium]
MTPMRALHVLLAEIVDYAGLFPPAALPMDSAVASYAAYLDSVDRWMLGRFVVPVSRLAEFERAAADRLPRLPNDAWRLSALVGADVAADVKAIGEFNCRHAAEGAGAVVVDSVELKATTPAEVVAARDRLPVWVAPFFEIPIDRDPSGLVDAIAQAGGRAKVRTGGVTADAFPPARDLARFLAECVRAGVPFKATAGLHHPLRAEYRLTYEPHCAQGTMYGFLNVFLAAAALRAGATRPDAEALLEERDAGEIVVEDAVIRWRDQRFDLAALHDVRQLALSFGSCSFEEPAGDLRALGLL